MGESLWAFIGVAGQQFCRLVVAILLARLLEPKEFGVVAAAQVILALSEVFVSFGVGGALIHAKKLSESAIRGAATFVWAACFVVFALILLFTEPLSQFLKAPDLPVIMPVVLVGFALRGVCTPGVMLLNRDMKFKRIAKIEIGSYLVGYALFAVILASFGLSYWSLVIASLIQAVLYFCCIFLSRPIFPTFKLNWAEIKPLYVFGAGMFGSQLLNKVARKGDNLVVSATLGQAALGYYSRGYALMDMANSTFGKVFYKVLFPGFSKQLRKDGGQVRQAKTLEKAHALAAFLMLPASAMSMIMATEIVLLLLGPKWTQVIPIFQILGVGMYFRLAYKVSGASVAATGVVYRGAALQLLYASAVIVGSVIGARYGLTGVATAVLIALSIQFLSLSNLALKAAGTNWKNFVRAVAPFTVASLIAATTCHVVAVALRSSNLNLISTLAAAGAVFVATYAAGLWLMKSAQSVQSVFEISQKILVAVKLLPRSA